MSEDRAQHELFMWFSQTYPHLEGDMFMVQNTTYSAAHGTKLKAMGLKKNVSDVILVLKDKCAFIELKAKDSTHKRPHIEGQFNWGKKRKEQGHFFVMTEKIDYLKYFITLLLQGHEEVARKVENDFHEDILELLQTQGKTIKF